MVSKQLILICAGGTGGHIIPGLSIAEKLTQRGYVVHWLGSANGLEGQLVSKAGFEISYISISGLRGKGWLTLASAPFRLIIALVQALKIIIRLQPILVIGMGGFVAGPAGAAAWLLRKRLVIHEQNAIPGTTNRILSMLATKILTGFPESFKNIRSKPNVYYTGNPVREILKTIAEPSDRFINRRHQKLRLLVIGGSRGAKILNTCVPVASSKCIRTKLEIWHQAGQNNVADTAALYKQQNIEAKVEAFIDDMKAAYEWADLVVCRSGALTIAELAAVGIGSILVPFRRAVDNHQLYNAKYLADKGAAIIVTEDAFTPEKLAGLLDYYAERRERLAVMAKLAHQQAMPLALENVVKHCIG